MVGPCAAPISLRFAPFVSNTTCRQINWMFPNCRRHDIALRGSPPSLGSLQRAPCPSGITTTALRRAPPRCLQPVAGQDMTCNDKKRKQSGMRSRGRAAVVRWPARNRRPRAPGSPIAVAGILWSRTWGAKKRGEKEKRAGKAVHHDKREKTLESESFPTSDPRRNLRFLMIMSTWTSR